MHCGIPFKLVTMVQTGIVSLIRSLLLVVANAASTFGRCDTVLVPSAGSLKLLLAPSLRHRPASLLKLLIMLMSLRGEDILRVLTAKVTLCTGCW